jgi:ribosomal protein S12 methylthiotransferase
VIPSSEISFYIISLGCSKNQSDSETVKGAMLSAGYQYSDSAENSDIIIINTCGFIKPAKEESISEILSAVDLKDINYNGKTKTGFSKKITVFGCLANRYIEEIKKDIPEIDFLYSLYDENFIKKMSESFSVIINEKLSYERSPLEPGLSYSYIKISDGCSNKCSYCAIPLIRGNFNPYPPEKIYADAENSVKKGVKELVIVAQDTALYKYKETTLPDLINKISEIAGVEWIRILYCHPDHIQDDLIALIKTNKKVLKYLDIPFQHANGKILKKMGRKGNALIYGELIKKIRYEIPEIRIRSTFMTGFPGETDEDFDELLDFLKSSELDRVGAFSYSKEENTAAYTFKNTVPEKIKKKRLDSLMKLQKKISLKKLESMIGNEVNIIIEEKLDDMTYLCRTEFDAPDVDGFFYLTTSDKVEINSIRRARVTDAVEYDLIGEFI